MSRTNPLPTAWTSHQRPGLLGTGVMIYVVDVAAPDDELFENWYTHEHLPERLAIPGFLRGRRYRHRDPLADGQHLTIYEVESPDVFTSDAYLERLESPTELTRSALAAFVHPQRAVLRVVLSHGATSGREVSLLRVSPRPELADQIQEMLPDLLRDSAVTGIHLASTDVIATGAKSRTTEGRGAPEEEASEEWLVMVEGVAGTAEAVRVVSDRCNIDAPPDTYDLLVTLDHHALNRPPR